MKFEFNPKVTLLLTNHSDEKVTMHYVNHSWTMQKIGPRPPYYVYPNYEMEFPVI
ncbi:hypothetical protein [Bacillus sp. JCM 19034]|uniref:hypothetical protein n=1 Tax=Bacillus sp. JCM 19034 TaxID=1481928 RepID=UPI0018D18466|nr:hypothetical protein [Bacillus sp. JCM 19034]